MKTHKYTADIKWTGNTGQGTSGYRSYKRSWQLASEGKKVIECSNDPLLGGDMDLYNPEDMLVASLASCHMLWYLHLCALAGVNVLAYQDRPEATGELEPSGAGRFIAITLNPEINISLDSDIDKANSIHKEIHQYCFIARSVNFPVTINPTINRGGEDNSNA